MKEMKRGPNPGGPQPATPTRLTLVGAAVLGVALLANELVFSGGGDKPRVDRAEYSTREGGGSGASRSVPRGAGFDYWVLAMSWSPAYCAGRPNARQCDARRRFILHGLWPQNENSYPTNCRSDYPGPNRRLLARYQDLSESRGLLRHQWRKHGACSGLSPEAYLRISRAAYEKIVIPPELKRVSRDTSSDPRVIESAFVRANPGLSRDGVTVKCKRRAFSEVRICLTKDLKPRRCGRSAIRDCGARRVDLLAP